MPWKEGIDLPKLFVRITCILLCLLCVAVIPASAEEVENAPLAEAAMRDIVRKLDGNTLRLLLFAAELNISNGPPDTRDSGERGMFGRLVNAEYVAAHYSDFEPGEESILLEAHRLLFGPWQNDGKTTFSFVTKQDVRILDYETGEWAKAKEVVCIRIAHTTEMSGMERVAYVALSTGQIVRK